MTAMVVLPVLIGLLSMYDRITPATVVARLMLLWALFGVRRGASTSVREWTDDIHLVVGALVLASSGLRDRPDGVFTLLTAGCFFEGLLATGLVYGWWGTIEVGREGPVGVGEEVGGET
jgi:hypothetical protein